jgi:DNA-binding NtrC family response regulator
MKNLSALFVNDEQFAVHSMERLLITSRLMASTLRGGQKALEILASVPVHIIASDMKLPGIDGLTLLMTVKEKYQDVIRLVLGGYTQTAQLLPCFNRGDIFRFITKPLGVDALTN